MQNKRTNSQIEEDYQKIIKLAQEYGLTNLSEISRKLGMSRRKVAISVARHQEWNEISNKKQRGTKKENNVQKIVIDASIAGCVQFKDVFEEILKEKGKIVITSVTIRELDSIQKFNDSDAYDARRILATAAENPEKFISVLIDETLETPDDCIIKFCTGNENVTLLTADKVMALKARMYKVRTRYLKQGNTVNVENQKRNKYITLRGGTIYKNDQIFIEQKHCYNKEIAVFSENGERYNETMHSLKIGDNVYVTSNKDEYIAFAHYEVVSIKERVKSVK